MAGQVAKICRNIIRCGASQQQLAAPCLSTAVHRRQCKMHVFFSTLSAVLLVNVVYLFGFVTNSRTGNHFSRIQDQNKETHSLWVKSGCAEVATGKRRIKSADANDGCADNSCYVHYQS